MMRRLLPLSWRVALLAMVVTTGLGAGIFGVVPATSEPGVVLAGRGYNPDSQECKFLRLINKYRNGGKLQLSVTLGGAATEHSKDQARRDKMYHSNLSQLLNKYNYNGSPTGENVAWGTNLDSAKEVFTAWKKSSSHDRNMKDKDFKAIGIARAKGNKGWYWTTIFGGKADKAANC